MVRQTAQRLIDEMRAAGWKVEGVFPVQVRPGKRRHGLYGQVAVKGVIPIDGKDLSFWFESPKWVRTYIKKYPNQHQQGSNRDGTDEHRD